MGASTGDRLADARLRQERAQRLWRETEARVATVHARFQQSYLRLERAQGHIAAIPLPADEEW